MTYKLKIIESKCVNESPFGGSSPSDAGHRRKLLAEFDGQKIVADDGEIHLLDAQGCAMWKHAFSIVGSANEAFVSADRLLLTTRTRHYHAWGHLGPAFLVDITDGTLIAELRGASGAALSNGSFLLGLEGYGLFRTWLYDRYARMAQLWPLCCW